MGFLLAVNARAWRNVALGGVVLVTLAGCEGMEGGGIFKAKPESVSASPAPSLQPLAGRDIEAPDVFQVSDKGLWDGRPSLGGVWVAHPDVSTPERVLIRNTANSKYVIGALFRRERTTPGPAFQVSSDAAVALGMLAGAPAQLNVTALRREEAAATLIPEPVETDRLDPVAIPFATVYSEPEPMP